MELDVIGRANVVAPFSVPLKASKMPNKTKKLKVTKFLFWNNR